jgi:hypothetical protein
MDLNYKKPNKSTSTLTVRPTCKSPRGKILFVHIDFQGFAVRRDRERKKMRNEFECLGAENSLFVYAAVKISRLHS